ncbi:MAG: hypothetical protein ACRYFS_24475 [Janthinobacterium lividum]
MTDTEIALQATRELKDYFASECERLQKDLAGANAEIQQLKAMRSVNIKDFRFTQQPGLTEGFFQAEFVPALADAIYGTMQETGAVNFVEFTVYAPKSSPDAYDRYILTFQKAKGLTPADKLKDAESKIQELEGIIANALA